MSMKIALAVATLLLTGCIPPPNTQGMTYEQRMMLFDRMRLQPYQVQYYPMQVPQYYPQCNVNGCR